jgi:sugar O-acyltransferase (sialic acid O-acetyltransferase NeuD family)
VRDVVLFGLGNIGQVVHYYMTEEGGPRVVAFTCDREFLDRDAFLDLPVVPFDEVQDAYPPDRFDMFVALGYQRMNDLRSVRLNEARAKGYATPSFVHPKASIAQDLVLGEHCLVLNDVCIQPQVRLGDNVFVWSGALLGHHSTIDRDSWISSHACIAGDVAIGRNCFVGLNATVGNNVSIGDECFLGANALVIRDVGDQRVVVQDSSQVLNVTPERFLKLSRFR